MLIYFVLIYIGQHTIFWFLSNLRAAKGLASQHMYAVLPDLSLLTHAKIELEEERFSSNLDLAPSPAGYVHMGV